MARPAEIRAKLFRAIHAEGAKAGLGHEELRDACREQFGVASMGDLTLDDLQQLYHQFAGRYLRAAKTRLPRRGCARSSAVDELVSAEHIETLGRAFAMRGWGAKTQREFIKRQLRGRHQIRTMADLQKVFRGVQAMNRRDGIAGA